MEPLDEVLKKRIVGYADRFSVEPGNEIKFFVSSDGIREYRADIVRLFSGDHHPDGAGFREELLPTSLSGTHVARDQEIRAGSYAVIDQPSEFPSLPRFTLQAYIWPTLVGSARQVIMGRWDDTQLVGYALVLDKSGSLTLEVGAGGDRIAKLSSGTPLEMRRWAFVAASFDGQTGDAVILQEPLAARSQHETVRRSETLGVRPIVPDSVPFMLAACSGLLVNGRSGAAAFYNGKLDRPRVSNRPLTKEQMTLLAITSVNARHSIRQGVVAAWDFSKDMESDRIRDIGPFGRDGRLVNFPARAMTGQNWDGTVFEWRQAPTQYGAIHFHDDDLYDAGWEASPSLTIPDEVPSGVYAARLCHENEREYIPFFVRPRQGTANAPLALLIPTASYMAYANEHAGFDSSSTEVLSGHLTAFKPEDLFLNEHREYGNSLYDTHSDGSGVCYSSRLRPILNMRPGYTNSWIGEGGSAPWQFGADLHLIDWLDREGFGCDIITDEDLDAEGLSLLSRYRVVMTGTHPEYYSTAMHDALGAYLETAGRLMYMGGNGFYWRVAYHPSHPGIIELRRAEDGIRDWVAEPGEYFHNFTGELGGLWRRLGRPPQALAGVGMAVQGFDVSGYYRRASASHDPRAAFIFAGVDDEIIGDFGVVGGGAAGLELDRMDRELGSPSNALVLATSAGLTNLYFPPPEEVNNVTADLDATQNPEARGDLVFFETPAGGAVFAVSSIAWAGSLSHNSFKNNVSRITGNVLRRFLDLTPFESPGLR